MPPSDRVLGISVLFILNDSRYQRKTLLLCSLSPNTNKLLVASVGDQIKQLALVKRHRWSVTTGVITNRIPAP